MDKPQHLNRRFLLTTGLAAAAFPALAQTDAPVTEDQDQVKSLPFHLKGRFVQSGYCIGKGTPGAELWVDGTLRGVTAKSGLFYVGFDRDSTPTCLIEVKGATMTRSARLNIAPTTYDIQRVDGLPPETVTPTDPATLDRIQREIALKNVGFASRDVGDAFRGGFRFPLKKFIVSGHFGNQRVLNGVSKSPHMGFDMAAAEGTPIHAPQSGLVTLAEPDLFYEGGLTLIDHGQGLISMYLHQSRLLVKAGDRVTQGQKIGEVGAKGRATGPHLCWRLKWRDRHMDPSLMVV